jgi:hypothetical protein
MKIERREFLKGSLAGTAGALLAGGCGNSRSRTTCNRNIGDAHAGSVYSLAVDPKWNPAGLGRCGHDHQAVARARRGLARHADWA